MDTNIRNRILVALAMAAVLGFTSDGAAGEEARHLYRCELQGTLTYSDTACDAEPDKVEINVDRLNTYDATELPRNVAYKSQSITRIEPRESPSASIAEEQMKHKQRCKEIVSRLDAVTEQMRRGDSGRGGPDRINRLREREREVEEQKRAEKCH